MINFNDKFQPVKVLTGKQLFEMMALQRTSKIFGITKEPWAAAAFQIKKLVVQMEKHLNSWDALAVNSQGQVRLVRHNIAIYELKINILPNTTGLSSNDFYYCSLCHDHIFQCDHLVNQQKEVEPMSIQGQLPVLFCPKCQGKVQNLGGDLYFCLDCNWESQALNSS